MTENGFRRIALSLPGVVEGEHMGHPDFRVGGKIFATLWPSGRGVVKLTSAQQTEFCDVHPEVFVPVTGAWGIKGATHVILKPARTAAVRSALLTAYHHLVP